MPDILRRLARPVAGAYTYACMPAITHPKPGSIREWAEALGLSRSAYIAALVDADLRRPAPQSGARLMSRTCWEAFLPVTVRITPRYADA